MTNNSVFVLYVIILGLEKNITERHLCDSTHYLWFKITLILNLFLYLMVFVAFHTVQRTILNIYSSFDFWYNHKKTQKKIKKKR
jgi:hypothetical protein